MCCVGLATLISMTAASSMWWLHITGSSQPIFYGEFLFLRHLLLICYIIQISSVSSAGELGCSLCWWCAWVRVSTFTPVFFWAELWWLEHRKACVGVHVLTCTQIDGRAWLLVGGKDSGGCCWSSRHHQQIPEREEVLPLPSYKLILG